MGIDELTPDGEAQSIINDASHITIQDLIDVYGEGPVKRALSYMASLEEAEEQWKESAKSSDYGDKYASSFGVDDDEVKDRVQEDWKEAMEEGGLFDE